MKSEKRMYTVSVAASVVGVEIVCKGAPGINRVSYDVQTHPMFHSIRVVAKKVRVAS